METATATLSQENVRRRVPARLRKPGRREQVAERQQQAVALRKVGATYDAIGAQLGTSAMQAHRDVAAALRVVVSRTRTDAEALIAMELERLDALQMFAWPRAQRGHVPSILTCTRISESRRRLLGLDAAVALPPPPQDEHAVVYAGMTFEELAARWERMRTGVFGPDVVVETTALPEPEPVTEPTTGDGDIERGDVEQLQLVARLSAYEMELREREAKQARR